MNYKRSDIAREAHIGIETLRYYETVGLLPAPQRDENGYRIYTQSTLDMLHVIHYAKVCGFNLKEIKDIIKLVDGTSVDYPRLTALIDEKMASIDERIHYLRHMKDALNRINEAVEQHVSCPVTTILDSLEHA